MVLKGQYLERMAIIDAGDVTLEGLYHRGALEPPVVIVPPHPAYGGSMDSTVVAEVAWAVARAGHASLRFNYRGIGASQGVWAAERDAEDLEAVVRHLAETTATERVALAGYSYGAWVAAAVAGVRPALPALILVSPPVTRFDFPTALAALRQRPGGAPRTLFVTGECDEIAPPEAVCAAASALGDAACVEVVAGADHGYVRGLPEVGALCARFLGAGGAEGAALTAR
ncbi:MAG: alpha/beta fold hydrolase [Deltaproteobacteria bacterium]|nr:MAG: alpha/beta fold hydrolase [Deltaproteobacteria bacterium]